MSWVVTLHVTDCNSHTNLGGCAITDGVSTYFTDPNGRFIAVVDDAYSSYGIQISHAGYYPLTYALSVVQNGTTQEVCLNPAPPPPPSPPSPGSGGW